MLRDAWGVIPDCTLGSMAYYYYIYSLITFSLFICIEPHPKYGHCRLFKVRYVYCYDQLVITHISHYLTTLTCSCDSCEDILSRFDTIFISRLPDSRRTSVFIQSQRLLSAHYTPPWMTGNVICLLLMRMICSCFYFHILQKLSHSLVWEWRPLPCNYISNSKQ